MAHLEIACFNKESALIAAEAGADRVELCACMELGGITPSVEDFVEIKKQIDIPIFVMIRPRGGNFFYTKAEIGQIFTSFDDFKKVGADGFVFGALDARGQIEETLCKKMLQKAEDLPCTFHRAIDDVPEIDKAVEKLIELGFATILSSGGRTSALEGLATLKELQEKYGKFINIMPGGSIRADNVTEVHASLQTSWIHSSAILEGQVVDKEEVSLLKDYLTSS